MIEKMWNILHLRKRDYSVHLESWFESSIFIAFHSLRKTARQLDVEAYIYLLLFLVVQTNFVFNQVSNFLQKIRNRINFPILQTDYSILFTVSLFNERKKNWTWEHHLEMNARRPENHLRRALRSLKDIDIECCKMGYL